MLLQIWGLTNPGATIPALTWAAALAGFADASGGFRSAGFKNPTEFSDLLTMEDDLDPIYVAVNDALKKVAPKATVTLSPSPATDSSNGEQQPT